MMRESTGIKRNKAQTIISAGHYYWIDSDGNEHITFFDNSFGKKLKEMWNQLHKPIKANK